MFSYFSSNLESVKSSGHLSCIVILYNIFDTVAEIFLNKFSKDGVRIINLGVVENSSYQRIS